MVITGSARRFSFGANCLFAGWSRTAAGFEDKGGSQRGKAVGIPARGERGGYGKRLRRMSRAERLVFGVEDDSLFLKRSVLRGGAP